MHIMLEHEDVLDSGQPLGEKEMKQMCGEEHKNWKEEEGTNNRKNAESKDRMADTPVGFDRMMKCPSRPIQLKWKGKVAAFSQC